MRKKESKVQVKINKFDFSKVKSSEFMDVHILNPDDAIPCTNAQSIYIEVLGKITGKNYSEINKDKKLNDIEPVDFMFVLSADSIDEKEVERFESVIKYGIHINKKHYVVDDIETSSETRKGDTPFILKEYADKVLETMSLGIFPNDNIEAVTSKVKGALGLVKSSAQIINKVPIIVVIPDHKKMVTEKVVNGVKKYKITEEDKNKKSIRDAERKVENERKKKYKEACNAYKPTNDDLEHIVGKFLEETIKKHHKTRSAWLGDGRRVKVEEIHNPISVSINTYNKEIKYHPCYSLEQTELVKKFPLQQYDTGYEVVKIKNHPVEVNCFDGMGIVDPEWLTETSQIRGFYIKGLVVPVDFKKYYAERNITHIKDVFNEEREIAKADMIISESMFKAKLDKKDNHKNGGWLFKNMQDYYDRLKKYEVDNIFAIAGQAKPIHKIKPYTKLTYQHLLALNLDFKDILELAKETLEITDKLIDANDISYVKAFFNMIEKDMNDDNDLNEDSSEEDVKEDKLDLSFVEKALEINHRMIADPYVKRRLLERAKNLYNDMLLGKVYVPAKYFYITGDIIGFLEWAQHQDEFFVDGFLQAGEFYKGNKCAGKEYGLLRNPLLYYGEVRKGKFIKSNNEYIKDLDNIIQVNMYDNTLQFLGGADLDGDKLLMFSSEIMKNKIVEAPLYVSIDEETEVKSYKFNKESLVRFKKSNLNNMTGIITTYATFFANEAMEREGDLQAREYELVITRHLQGLAIDQVKTNVIPDVPDIFNKIARYKTYFLRYKYNEYNKKYQKREYAKSPLNKFVKYIERKKRVTNFEEVISNEYFYDTMDTKELIVDYNKFSFNQQEVKDIINCLKQVWDNYETYKSKIDNNKRKFDAREGKYGEMSEHERKAHRQKIRENYSKLNDVIRKEALEVCDNESILASICAEIAYNWSKYKNKDYEFTHRRTFNFPWICSPYGVLENLLTNEDKNKISVIPCPRLDSMEIEANGVLHIKNGVANFKEISFPAKKFKDGKYRLYTIMGRHYIDYDKEFEIGCVKVKKEQGIINENGEKETVEMLVPLQTSPSIKKETIIKPIKDYNIKLIKLQEIMSPELTSEMIGCVYTLQGDKIYESDKLIGTIRPEDMISENVELRNHNGMNVVVKEIVEVSKTGRSFTIKVDIY